ncbi:MULTISPECIES: DUF2953 domain-containing protein [Bacillus]|uniref:DUF2953 domain-containing protein n=1 Tax=Bacillus TaxID=1386 RepID=UPI001CDD1CC2|nr:MULTISPECIES: DUF2953 domain-containing protein [Bacillus]MCY7767228.1 DUF2953 domain-containing protein [Bacillus inaquosorum]MCY9097795.1 DUF2953 domain-containing protein [Bacillus inaquosorum]MCY9310352.1 DUF2953 domain-containing protein [Bacillus inaquosorum]MCY9382403.1 DUF2953 domain-containing protein [Bacillus inaquosorum]MEC0534990.1 DUF2953 domain-containing protein [Bacillus inaquosorum]
MVYVLTAILILIGIVLLLRMKIYVAAEYLHADDNDKITLKITALFGLIRVKKTIPAIKVNKNDGTVDLKQKSTSKVKKSSSKKKITFDDVQQTIKKIEMLVHQVTNLRKTGASILAHLHITKLEWVTVVGIQDAAVTGVLTGAVWGVKGGIAAMLYDHLDFVNKPVYKVIPSFQVPVSKTHFQCIFFFRFGHAMLAAFKFVKYGRELSALKKNPSSRMTSKNDSSV